RDVRDACPSIFDDEDDLLLQKSIQSIMTEPVTTVHPLDFVAEIARIFYEEEFGALPVVRNEKLIGMITEKDMLYTLIVLTDNHVQSSYIEMKVPQDPGATSQVHYIIGMRKVSILVLFHY